MLKEKNAILVAGSLNMDFVVQVAKLPAAGETVLGSDFRLIPGGKGANQANAAGRLANSGAQVRMAGMTGDDAFAEQLKQSLAASGVDVSAVSSIAGEPTGVALIWVEESGQNSIVVASGANTSVSPEYMDSLATVFAGAACVLFQLESPLAAVERGMRMAQDAGAMTILDPAPARPLPAEVLRMATYLTPNEMEAQVLLGRRPERVGLSDALEIARGLHALGPAHVILKLGDEGCFYTDGKLAVHSPGFKVQAVDSTAAGDTFNAALAVALAEEQELEAALRFANAAAALSVTKLGAQASAPSRGEVEQFLMAH